MADSTYRAAIIGLGFIGGADQVSGDALGQQVRDLDGTHVVALSGHPRVELVAGSSRDAGRRERFEQRTGVRTFADWREMLEKEGDKLDGLARACRDDVCLCGSRSAGRVLREAHCHHRGRRGPHD